MPRELLIMQNSFQWVTAEGQTLEIENAIRSNVRGLKIEGQTYQNLLSETKSLRNFVYDDITGEYTLTDPTVDSWNSMSINYTRPIQAGEKLLLRINIVKNTIEATDVYPLKIIFSDGGTVSTGFINIENGVTGLFEYYCDGASITEHYRNIFEITTRAYTSGELVIKDIQVIPVSSNPLSYTELPTSINGIESVAERESKNLLENVKWHDGWIDVMTGAFDSTHPSYCNAKYSDLISIDVNNNYYFSLTSNNNENVYRIRPYDADGNYVTPIDDTGNPILGNSFDIFYTYRRFFANVKYIRILLLDPTGYPPLDSLIFSQNIYTEYESNLYSVKITNRGKNLLDLSTFNPISYSNIQASIDEKNVITVKGLKTADVEAYTDPTACNLKVYLEEGKTYSVSFKSDGKFGVRNGEDTVEMFFMLDGTTTTHFNVAGERTVTIPRGFTGNYYVRCDVNSGDKTHKFWDIQVEEGDTVTDYEPYREPTPTEIPLPQPLRSLPNGVCDTIEGNKLVQRVGMVVLDGSTDEEWKFESLNKNENGLLNIYIVTPNVVVKEQSEQALICDKFPHQKLSIANTTTEGVLINNQKRIWLRLYQTNASTVDEAKNYLSNNPITVYYELETPIIHDLTIPSIYTEKGTNIITTANNIKPNMSMKAKVKK